MPSWIRSPSLVVLSLSLFIYFLCFLLFFIFIFIETMHSACPVISVQRHRVETVFSLM